MKTTTEHKCPICGSPLAYESNPKEATVWCPCGPCPSITANIGSIGRTVEEAADKLESILAQEVAR